MTHAKQAEDNNAEQDVVDHIIEIADPWSDRWWIESNFMNWQWVCQILVVIPTHVDFEWTE